MAYIFAPRSLCFALPRRSRSLEMVLQWRPLLSRICKIPPGKGEGRRNSGTPVRVPLPRQIQSSGGADDIWCLSPEGRKFGSNLKLSSSNCGISHSISVLRIRANAEAQPRKEGRKEPLEFIPRGEIATRPWIPTSLLNLNHRVFASLHPRDDTKEEEEGKAWRDSTLPSCMTP